MTVLICESSKINDKDLSRSSEDKVREVWPLNKQQSSSDGVVLSIVEPNLPSSDLTFKYGVNPASVS